MKKHSHMPSDNENGSITHNRHSFFCVVKLIMVVNKTHKCRSTFFLQYTSAVLLQLECWSETFSELVLSGHFCLKMAEVINRLSLKLKCISIENIFLYPQKSCDIFKT